MEWYVFAFTKEPKGHILLGFSPDINKTVTFFKKLPNINNKKQKLIYIEIYQSENEALQRYQHLLKATAAQKAEVIEAHNPEYVEYIIGQNIMI